MSVYLPSKVYINQENNQVTSKSEQAYTSNVFLLTGCDHDQFMFLK